MKLYTFCDLKFQNLSIEKAENFSIRVEAQLNTLMFMLNAQRFFWKWLSLPWFVLLFVLTSVGVLTAPADRLGELQERVKKQREEAARARGAAAAASTPAPAAPPAEETAAPAEASLDAKVLSN